MTSAPNLPVLRKLSPRLQHIYNWAIAAGPYTHVWDLCCDHGRLGLHLHQSQSLGAAQIHLIDCVPSVINDLKEKCEPFTDSRLQITCADACQLQLPLGGQHLIILAGIGGETLVKILAGIVENINKQGAYAADTVIEFMLSPNLNNFEVRRFLRSNYFELLKEEFVSDNGWHHEHMHLRFHFTPGMYPQSSEVGDLLWQPFSQDKKVYLQKYYAHYKNRVELGGDQQLLPAVQAYAKLLAAYEGTDETPL